MGKKLFYILVLPILMLANPAFGQDTTFVNETTKRINLGNGQVQLSIGAGHLYYQKFSGQWDNINVNIFIRDEHDPDGYLMGNRTNTLMTGFPDTSTGWVQAKDRFNRAVRQRFIGAAYLDRRNNDYQLIGGGANPSTDISISENSITYMNIYSGVDLRYIVNAGQLKVELEVSQQTRMNLNSPYPDEHTMIVLVTEVQFDNLTAVNVRDGSSVFGENVVTDSLGIEFSGDHYFEWNMPFGEAFAVNNPNLRYKMKHKTVVKNGRKLHLAGIPFNKVISTAYDGAIIFDPTVTTQPGAAAGKDTYFRDADPDQANGTLVEIDIESRNTPDNRHALVQFDTLSIISSAATIDSAFIHLYFHANSVSDDSLASWYRITEEWTEGITQDPGVASWDTAMTGVPWTTGGGTIDNTKYGTKIIPELAVTDDEIIFDITTLVQGWVDGTWTNYGMLLKFDTPNGAGGTGYAAEFYSSDDADATKRPKLIVYYSLSSIELTVTSEDSTYKNITVQVDTTNNGKSPADSMVIISSADSSLLSPWAADTVITSNTLSDNTLYSYRIMAYTSDDTVYSDIYTIWTKRAFEDISITKVYPEMLKDTITVPLDTVWFASAKDTSILGSKFVAHSDISMSEYSEKSLYTETKLVVGSGVFFKPDGTKLYASGWIGGYDGGKVVQYKVTTQWDVSTAVYDTIYTVLQDYAPTDLFFKSDGTKMYVLGSIYDSLYQYTLSVPWDVSTASYDSKSYGNFGESSPQAVYIGNNGVKLYEIGYVADYLRQYTLSTPWDISTASHTTAGKSLRAQDDLPVGISFNNTGTAFFMVGYENDSLYQYTVSTAWDITTLSYANKSFYVGNQDGLSHGLYIRNDFQNFYMIGLEFDSLYQYNIRDSLSISGLTADSLYRVLFVGTDADNGQTYYSAIDSSWTYENLPSDVVFKGWAADSVKITVFHDDTTAKVAIFDSTNQMYIKPSGDTTGTAFSDTVSEYKPTITGANLDTSGTYVYTYASVNQNDDYWWVGSNDTVTTPSAIDSIYVDYGGAINSAAARSRLHITLSDTATENRYIIKDFDTAIDTVTATSISVYIDTFHVANLTANSGHLFSFARIDSGGTTQFYREVWDADSLVKASSDSSVFLNSVWTEDSLTWDYTGQLHFSFPDTMGMNDSIYVWGQFYYDISDVVSTFLDTVSGAGDTSNTLNRYIIHIDSIKTIGDSLTSYSIWGRFPPIIWTDPWSGDTLDLDITVINDTSRIYSITSPNPDSTWICLYDSIRQAAGSTNVYIGSDGWMLNPWWRLPSQWSGDTLRWLSRTENREIKPAAASGRKKPDSTKVKVTVW